MKLYDSGIILVGVIAFVTYGVGYIIHGKVTEEPIVDYAEQRILEQGYQKTNYSYNELPYTDFIECVEYKNNFYCY